MSEKIVEQPTDLERENRRNLRRLVLSMQASLGKLSLLIGICDNFNYRDTLIQAYETELQAKGVVCYRVSLDRDRPSLKQALLDLWEAIEILEPDLQVRSDSPKIVTVLGADELLGIPLNEAKSAQEKFFFSVQWTRESLRQFQLPIVIWVTEKIATGLAQQAPDFWSWRGGVFEFKQPIVYSAQEPQPLLFRSDESSASEPLANPTEIKQQIEALLAEDPNSPLLGSLYSSLGQTYYNRLAQGKAEDYPQEQQQAIAAFQNAIERAKAANDDVKLAIELSYLAEVYRQMGRYEQAEPLYLQTLELKKHLLGDNHPSVATTLNNLAELYRTQGRYNEAEPLLLQALALYKRLLGDHHLDVATSLNNLALLYYAQGRYEQAEPLLLQALELRKHLLGDNHLNVASSLNNLAELYRTQGRYEEAELLYLQALELRKRLLRDNHPDVVTSLNNLATLYYAQGQYEQAEPLLLQALELDKRLVGDNHPNVATSLNNLAELYYAQGRYEQAELLYLQALELHKRLLGDNHPHVASNLNNLAALYYAQGRYGKAEPLLLQALELYKRLLGDNHPDVATSLNNLALLYEAQGRYEQAEPLLRQAVEILERTLGSNHPHTVTCRKNLQRLRSDLVQHTNEGEFTS